MIKIITYGTFDLLHYGHINLFERLRAMGDHLTVGISSDEFNAVKGKKAVFSLEKRIKLVGSIKYVDKIIIENTWEQKVTDIKKMKINIFGIGDDWVGKFDHLNELVKVVYLPRTENISSTIIRSLTQNNA